MTEGHDAGAVRLGERGRTDPGDRCGDRGRGSNHPRARNTTGARRAPMPRPVRRRRSGADPGGWVAASASTAPSPRLRSTRASSRRSAEALAGQQPGEREDRQRRPRAVARRDDGCRAPCRSTAVRRHPPAASAADPEATIAATMPARRPAGAVPTTGRPRRRRGRGHRGRALGVRRSSRHRRPRRGPTAAATARPGWPSRQARRHRGPSPTAASTEITSRPVLVVDRRPTHQPGARPRRTSVAQRPRSWARAIVALASNRSISASSNRRPADVMR